MPASSIRVPATPTTGVRRSPCSSIAARRSKSSGRRLTALWATDEQQAATTRHLYVGFADMVGFTARTQVLATSDLVAVIDRFERQAGDVIARHGGRLIKLIGDGVMYAATEGDAACAIALELVETTGRAGLPDVRAGLAVGPVISRSGDFYGPVVNVAARLASVASRGEVLAFLTWLAVERCAARWTGCSIDELD